MSSNQKVYFLSEMKKEVYLLFCTSTGNLTYLGWFLGPGYHSIKFWRHRVLLCLGSQYKVFVTKKLNFTLLVMSKKLGCHKDYTVGQ